MENNETPVIETVETPVEVVAETVESTESIAETPVMEVTEAPVITE